MKIGIINLDPKFADRTVKTSNERRPSYYRRGSYLENFESIPIQQGSELEWFITDLNSRKLSH